MKYNVNEIFDTVQGEGAYTGTPSVFIRLQGCPVGCPWCDTKHTWYVNPDDKVHSIVDKTESKSTYAEMSAKAIGDYVKYSPVRHAVLTGGEPCMYDLNPLCAVLFKHGFAVQIETSGTYVIRAPDSVWVTVSPKINMPGGRHVLSESLQRANEIKHPVGKQRDVDNLKTVIGDNCKKLVYLQPLSQSHKATELCIQQAGLNNWRISAQLHKYIGVR